MGILILAAYFVIAGDVTGGVYQEDILGPFISKSQCEQIVKDINGAANSYNSPIRIETGMCRSHEEINRVNQSWSLLGPLIANRQAMGVINYDVWKRPNAPHPVRIPRYGVRFPGEVIPNTKVQCTETGCRVSVDGIVTKEIGQY
jgi:hypothetical protein